MDIKLEYGKRDGQFVHISKIEPTQKGEKCNCTCPVCGGILVAKLGNIRQRHFAHKISNNCDIAYAQQTSIHLLAEEIIRESHSILVPGIEFTKEEITSDNTDDSVDIELPNINSCQANYDSVKIEEQIKDIVADAVINVNGKDYIVEVAVTHFVDEIKKEKLKKIGLSAFEIDLRDLWKSSPSPEEVAVAVLSVEKNRKWIFNQKREALKRKAIADYQAKIASVAQKRKQEEARKQLERKRKQEQQQQQQMQDAMELQELMTPEKYSRELHRLRSGKQADGWLKHFKFSEKLSEYPFYMDIPISGEFVFSCDRRIWQGLLFDEYVYKGFNKKRCTFTIPDIKKWIEKRDGQIKYDEKRSYATSLIINGKEQKVSFSYDVVWRYFEYLELLGFVYHIDRQWYSERPISLNPPNQSAARVLNDILKSVDCSLPIIDQIIKSELLSRLSEDEKAKVLEWDQRKNRPPGYYNIPG